MVLWVVSLRRLREYYQSVLANTYRKQMRWGYIPSAATTAKARLPWFPSQRARSPGH